MIDLMDVKNKSIFQREIIVTGWMLGTLNCFTYNPPADTQIVGGIDMVRLIFNLLAPRVIIF
jgi:hypothetical protein